jgi:hypothetical protein
VLVEGRLSTPATAWACGADCTPATTPAEADLVAAPAVVPPELGLPPLAPVEPVEPVEPVPPGSFAIAGSRPPGDSWILIVPLFTGEFGFADAGVAAAEARRRQMPTTSAKYTMAVRISPPLSG